MGSSAKRSVPVALTTTTTGTAEVLEAQARIWCDTFGYLKSVALHSAIKLGVPNAMSHRGGAASLAELHAEQAAVPVAPHEVPGRRQESSARKRRILLPQQRQATNAATASPRRLASSSTTTAAAHACLGS
jgi:hypothetical protein